MSSPLVSIIMPTFNHEAFVAEAIKSVGEQTYTNIELIIIDDGSSDGTVDAIKGVISEIPKNIKVIFRTQANKGICKTLNRGLDLCDGEYVQFLASDDLYCSNKTIRCIEALISAPSEVAAVYCDGYIFNETAKHNSIFSSLYPVPIGRDTYRELLIGNWMPAMGLFYRRKDLDLIGRFDESLHYEDWDLLLRLAKKKKIMRIADRLFFYRVHEKNITKDSALMGEMFKVLTKKHKDLEKFIELKKRLRISPIKTFLKNINDIDLIVRLLVRRLLVNKASLKKMWDK